MVVFQHSCVSDQAGLNIVGRLVQRVYLVSRPARGVVRVAAIVAVGAVRGLLHPTPLPLSHHHSSRHHHRPSRHHQGDFSALLRCHTPSDPL